MKKIKELREKPVKIGICKICNNPIYQWEKGKVKKQDVHETCKDGDYD